MSVRSSGVENYNYLVFELGIDCLLDCVIQAEVQPNS